MTTSTTRANAPGTGPTGPTGSSTPADPAVTRPASRPDFADEPATFAERFLVGVFVAVPLLALITAIPLAWGWGLGWHDVIIALAFYWLTGLGVTVGYHRYFTHGSFKAKT
ncbi:MAG TPA: acyl-CoA desaturase, partial [Streptosporangiaceae bacterium]|nr:acyl-CoA desaturase [Streptosporangiaceae bacterium]